MARQNYENGYYIGAVNADGKRHGYGTYYWNSGSRYEGDWYLGDMHGHGTYYYKDGDKYEGEFYHDDRHGFGVFSYTSGARYEGEYRNDKRTGKGTYFYADGDKYVGDFVDGDFHGKGTYYWNSGAWYEGDWANDERNGMGTYHYPDGTWTYGEYKDSKLVRTVRSSQTLNNGGCQQRRKVCIEDIRDGLGGDDNGDVREQTADNGNGGNNVRTVKYSNGLAASASLHSTAAQITLAIFCTANVTARVCTPTPAATATRVFSRTATSKATAYIVGKTAIATRASTATTRRTATA